MPNKVEELQKPILKQGDTKDKYYFILIDDNGLALNLTNTVVTVHIATKTALVLTKDANIDDPVEGKISFAFDIQDNLPSGRYDVEFMVAFGDGNIETFPETGYVVLDVIPNLRGRGSGGGAPPSVDFQTQINVIDEKVDDIDTRVITLEQGGVGGSDVVDSLNNGYIKVDNQELLVYDDTAITNTTNALTKKTSGYVNVMEFSVKGDGSQDDAPGIKAAIAYAQTIGKQTVYVPAGVYHIGSTITVPIRMRLQMSLDTVLKPIANVNMVQIKPESQVFGGTFNVKDMGASWDKACIYANGNDNFQPYEHLCILRDINFVGEDHYYTDQNWTGTAIHFYSGTGQSVKGFNESYISYIQVSNINITNFYYGIRLEQEKTPVVNESWITACTFDQIGIMNAVRTIEITGDSNILQGGHSFTNLQLQGFKYCERLIYCDGANNNFQGTLWDLHLMTLEGGKAIEFGSVSRWNYVNSNVSHYYGGARVIDNGLSNIIYSPQDLFPARRATFNPMPIAGHPNFMGNQDDYLLYGHKRGYIVTQTSNHPLPTNPYTGETGVFDALFEIDTEVALEWDMTTATEANPIVVVIDCRSDPISGASFIGAISPYTFQPANLLIEINIPGYGWMTDISYSSNSSKIPITLIETWASGDIVNQIRLKFWGTENGNTAQISRVVGASTSGGNAYVSQNGGTVNGLLNTKGGFVLPTTTSDPNLPAVGQMWLRTDL